MDKTDGINSFVIADFAHVGRISVSPWRGSQYLALQRLTRQRMHITICIAKEKIYMLNNIPLKFSELTILSKDEHLFSCKYSATVEAIFAEFKNNENLINASAKELTKFINPKSHSSSPIRRNLQSFAGYRSNYLPD